ncbi:MAG: hypothetical protein OEY38_21480 [Gammaproteobacteria bacterium]|nr:hypothetical protein [Gammaproteobacteria bacterium]
MEAIAYLKAAAWTAGTVAGLFAATHQVSKASYNKSLATFLKESSISHWLNNWPSEFAKFFDSVFDHKHFTLKCFLRSCIASTVALILTIVGFFLIADIGWAQYWQSWSGVPTDRIVLAFTIILLGNFIPDYLSLLETRFILSRITSSPTLFRTFFLLVLDLFLTALVFIVFITIFNQIYFGTIYESVFDSILERFLHYVTFYSAWLADPHVNLQQTDTFENAIQFVTTFLTSIWLWCFAFITFLLTITNKLVGRIWRWLCVHFFDLEEKPILALGWASSATILVIFLVLSPFLVDWIPK